MKITVIEIRIDLQRSVALTIIKSSLRVYNRFSIFPFTDGNWSKRKGNTGSRMSLTINCIITHNIYRRWFTLIIPTIWYYNEQWYYLKISMILCIRIRVTLFWHKTNVKLLIFAIASRHISGKTLQFCKFIRDNTLAELFKNILLRISFFFFTI